MVGQDGLVIQIGKDLRRWNGIDAGVVWLAPTIFEALADVIGEKRSEYQLSQAITRMIQLGYPLQARDVSGCFWQDVDTWEDLMLVRQSLVG